MKEYICCFTGHRRISFDHVGSLPIKLDKAIAWLYEKGVRTFISGGALGFDTAAALAVIDFRKTHPDVKLHMVLPCRDQDKFWKLPDKLLYRKILRKSDEITYVADKYTNGCMFDRNRKMVDLSQVCVAYYDGGDGGTAYTYSYAKRKGMKIFNLYDTLENE